MMIEGIFLAAHALETPAQNLLKLLGVTRSASERMLSGFVPHSTKADDGGMDLIAAQPQSVRRQRPRTSVGREWIGAGAPRQVVRQRLA